MFPKYEDVITPLLFEIAKRGGRTAPTDRDGLGRSVYDALAVHFSLSQEERERRTSDGEQRSFWEKMVRWARQKLYDDGFLVPPVRGVWQLTGSWNAYLSEMPGLQSQGGDELVVFEGRLCERLHRFRERSARVTKRKKQWVLKSLGRLDCEVCRFSFQDRYGPLGSNFAECHHRIPLSELRTGQPTTLSDLAVVCANCHRMIHRVRPWLTIDELRGRIQRT